ncbi:uncharacterized protein G2W53_023023 [Senna tora]|uniref:Uncharacterized protein n=1 Tax=Senna tora TaxID=362788 RepID=A0A834TVD0_9FABA|nr:uncharacterized protein G2W53_023023 [Senna tora]
MPTVTKTPHTAGDDRRWLPPLVATGGRKETEY